MFCGTFSFLASHEWFGRFVPYPVHERHCETKIWSFGMSGICGTVRCCVLMVLISFFAFLNEEVSAKGVQGKSASVSMALEFSQTAVEEREKCIGRELLAWITRDVTAISICTVAFSICKNR